MVYNINPASPINITGDTTLQIVARAISGNGADQFTIALVDSDGDWMGYTFSFVLNTSALTTLTINLLAPSKRVQVGDGDFNMSQVSGWAVVGDDGYSNDQVDEVGLELDRITFTPGIGNDQIKVTSGSVNLGGATLNAAMNPGLTPSVGQQFTIINNQSGTPITTTFAGSAQNAVTTIGGFSFSINYSAGAGNDSVVLTRWRRRRASAPIRPPPITRPPGPAGSRHWSHGDGDGPQRWQRAVADRLAHERPWRRRAGRRNCQRQCRGGDQHHFQLQRRHGSAHAQRRGHRAHYQQVLESITYNNTNGGPGVAPKPSAWWPRMPTVAAQRSPTRSP